jgi:REP-associated tyrosine transposase
MKSPRNKIVHSSASYRLYLHLVWPTKYRKHILGEKLTPVVESKILEVCQTKQYQLFVVKAAVDHMHVLLGMRPTQAVSDVVRDLKSNSSAAAFATFSRLSEIIKMDVLWAEGYRAESVSPGELERVRRYIVSQVEHHRARFRFRATQDAKRVDYGEVRSKAKKPPLR